jgi:hypothetical protein
MGGTYAAICHEREKNRHEALQVCYARGKLDNAGIKGYLPKKRKEDNF